MAIRWGWNLNPDLASELKHKATQPVGGWESNLLLNGVPLSHCGCFPLHRFCAVVFLQLE